MIQRLLLVFITLFGGAAAPTVRVYAQASDEVIEDLDLSPAQQRENAELDRALATQTRAEREAAVVPTVQAGQVLSAIPGVRETESSLQLSYAFSQVHAKQTSRVHSVATHPSTISLAVRLPDNAYFARASRLDGETQHAVRVTRELMNDGTQLRIDAGLLASGASCEIVVEYAVDAQMHNGHVHLMWPARGRDARAARTRVELAGGNSGWSVDGTAASTTPFDVDAETPIDFEIVPYPTRMNHRVTELSENACDGAPCEVHAFLGPQGNDRFGDEAILLIDASPSMRGPASGRLLPVLGTIVSSTYDNARVRALAFGASAEPLIAEKQLGRDVSLDRFAAVTSLDLGAATQPENASTTLSRWLRDARGDKHVVIVTDGGLTTGAGTAAFFAQLRRSNAQVNVVLLSNAEPAAAWREIAEQTRGTVLHVEREADALQRNAADTRLAHMLAQLRAPVRETYTLLKDDGTQEQIRVRWGESLVRRIAVRRRNGAQPIEIVDRRTHVSDDNGAGHGVPAETVLQMLRQRIIPAARACFRNDRRGRGNYAVRATYAFALENREISAIDVTGDIAPALQQCLRETITRLDVPYFEGRVVVRYPLQTQAAAPEPHVELPDELRTRLQALFPDRSTDELLRE